MKIYLKETDPRYKEFLANRSPNEESEPYILLCNKCEKETPMSHPGDYWSENLMHFFSIGFGYGSRYDMDSWDFHLCEKCLLDIIFSLKIPPRGHYSYPSKDDFERWKKQERLPRLLEDD